MVPFSPLAMTRRNGWSASPTRSAIASAAKFLVGGKAFVDKRFFRRQINPRRSAFPDLAGNGHPAAVVGDDAINQRESQAPVRWPLRREKRLENSRQRRLLD